MTKVHEKVYRGQIRELLETLPEDEIKGEFTVIVDGKGKNVLQDAQFLLIIGLNVPIM